MKLFKAKDYKKINKEEPCTFTSPLGEIRLEVYYGPENEKLDNLVTEPDKAEVYQLPSGAWVSSWETEEFILEILISPLLSLCPEGEETITYGCLYRFLPKVYCANNFKLVMRLIDKLPNIWREFSGDDTSELIILEYEYDNKDLYRYIMMSVPVYESFRNTTWAHDLGVPKYMVELGVQEFENCAGYLHMFEDSSYNSGFTHVFTNLRKNILFQFMYFVGWLKEHQCLDDDDDGGSEVYDNIDFKGNSLNRVLENAGCE